ncbi:MAG TPA: ribosome maturation factor RimP [Ilumatobacteraceae bacterium]|nr:ribosome maturation factor RimP [Ilumatobacteraceae bacterium]
MSASTEIDRVHALVAPIAADLQLDVYDIERRGATMRITLDTLPGTDGGITLDSLSLATRLISRELDHDDPIAGHYTLEVTSPGLERQLRTPAHFQREVGKTVSVRLRDPQADPRRVQGALIAADDRTATLMLDDGTERSVSLDDVDKARTVFEWGPKPKPGKQSGKQSSGPKKPAAKKSAEHVSGSTTTPNTSSDITPNTASDTTSNTTSNKEKQAS